MQASFSELEYATKQKQTRRDRFLAQIESVTPWSALTQVIAPHYPSSGGRGRPPIVLERILRMYVAQQCFGLSDEGIEDAVYDSQAIRRFVGIDLAREAAPDATTVLGLRRLLEERQARAQLQLVDGAEDLARGAAAQEVEVAAFVRLQDVGWTMTDASLCGLGQTAASAVLSAMKIWPELFQVGRFESWER